VQVLIQNPISIILLLIIIAFLVYTAIRVGPAFLIKRLAGLVFVAIGVTFITFILGFWGGGKNGENSIIIQCGIHCTQTTLQNLENFYGLRDPWYIQYGHFLQRLVHLDLGFSYDNRERTVISILGSGIPVSVDLQVEALIAQLIIGVPLGILAALRAGTRVDTGSMGFALLLYSLPSYILILTFQVAMVKLAQHNLPHLPIYGWNGPFAIQAVAPVIIIAAIGMAYFTRLTRSNMLEVLGQDYIRTARAKGLRERAVIYRHAFRNALIPLVTALGPTLAFAVTGAFFTETFFQIPGIGYISVQSIQTRDLPVIQGTVLIAAFAVALMNLIADVVYGILDPRIKVV
jgi:ABC-type dipeptide/oligopeptide/nickel transport system permease component